jgi:glyoxylase-like metal-dependent hydrolase (beta-lactamase superfamily II)
MTGARLAASAETARLLRTPGYASTRGWVLTRPRVWPPRPIEVDEVLTAGQVLDAAGGIEVIEAPGHMPGGLAFHCYGPNALAVGDAAAVHRRSGRLTAPPARPCADPQQARDTAQRLAQIEARVLCPGHGLPTVDGRRPARVIHRA